MPSKSAAARPDWQVEQGVGPACLEGVCCTEMSQQPGGGEAPAIEVVAVALIGAFIAGLVRSIEMASLHAAEFGVGITAEGWLMLVLPMFGSGD